MSSLQLENKPTRISVTESGITQVISVLRLLANKSDPSALTGKPSISEGIRTESEVPKYLVIRTPSPCNA